jgi:serine/threonine protein kinase
VTQASDDSDFRIGPYRVLRHIAQGGMGAVYEVEDPSAPGRFALKLGANDGGQDPKLFQIHRALSSIPHPGIIACHAVGTTPDGRSFQLLDLIEGQPAQVFAKAMGAPGSPPRTTAVITLAIHLAEALAHLHKHDIIHRDIKSANVMVRADQTACLIDFGAAILPGLPARLGHFVGTYSYAAPEQIKGEAIDQRADIYAMGVLIYRMLSGRRPFEAETTEALIDLKLNTQAPRLDAQLKDIPPQVVALTMSMLETSPDSRPRSAGEVAQALRQA